jgi:hypothetical protein
MDSQNNNYEERLDKIFVNGSLWKHRTFRTILDPYSSEWNQTSMQEKTDILKKLKENNESLEELLSDYEDRYLEQNRRDIVYSAKDALIKIINFQL